MSLAKQLNNFFYEIFQNKTLLENMIQTIQNKELFKRILFNRLCYALFHKYLELDNELKYSSVKQYETIIEKLRYASNTKFYQKFVKLQNLRIWAEYRYFYDKEAKNINLNSLLRDAYVILKVKSV